MISIASLATLSCSENGDTTKPQIEVLKPAEMEYVLPDAANPLLDLSIIFTDNETLKQAEIEFHQADDGHVHKSLLTDEAGAWDTLLDISGKQASFAKTLDLTPYLIEGINEYHLFIRCTDEAGNLTETSRLIERE